MIMDYLQTIHLLSGCLFELRQDFLLVSEDSRYSQRSHLKQIKIMSEKFALKWKDYQSNWFKSLSDLRKETDFADVTLRMILRVLLILRRVRSKKKRSSRSLKNTNTTKVQDTSDTQHRKTGYRVTSEP